MKKKTIIGITIDSEIGGYSNFPWYCLRANYSQAIANHNATAILLPYDLSAVQHYIRLIDGLIITGGNFDINPSLYNEQFNIKKGITKDLRTKFEFEILNSALSCNMPILGICGGHQLINVALGGTLIQDIETQIPNCLQHEQPEPKNLPWHLIEIKKDTLLHKITNSTEIKVNSTHHQAIDKLGRQVAINAIASDGVIEAIESLAHRFCLGVEWHPEYQETQHDRAIFKGFVEACLKKE